MIKESARIKRRWTVKEINLLVDMTNRGVARREICAALGRQYEAVRTKQHQMQNEEYNYAAARTEVPFKAKWYKPDQDGLYEKARQILGCRWDYHKVHGNMVDGQRVSVRVMLGMAGFKVEG